jgi:hypothetical protein
MDDTATMLARGRGERPAMTAAQVAAMGAEIDADEEGDRRRRAAAAWAAAARDPRRTPDGPREGDTVELTAATGRLPAGTRFTVADWDGMDDHAVLDRVGDGPGPRQIVLRKDQVAAVEGDADGVDEAVAEALATVAEAGGPERKARPTKTKEMDDLYFDLGDVPGFRDPADSPLAAPPEPGPPPADPRRRASAARTAAATAGIDMGPSAAAHIANLTANMPGADTDDGEVEPAPVTVDDLPAVLGRAMTAAGQQVPEFHQVSALPGNASRAIRGLGKSLFSTFTRTPTADIWVVANLAGQGPNTDAEVDAVASAAARGEPVTGPGGEADFAPAMPGYRADVREYSYRGLRMLVVRDEFGRYVYSWPEGDSVRKWGPPALPRTALPAPRESLLAAVAGLRRTFGRR